MTLDELRNELLYNKQALEETANYYDRDVNVYSHWTAGDYDQVFDDYHLCIDGRGGLHYTRPLSEAPAATWHRNSGSIAIALCCAQGAMAYAGGGCKLGNYPPTDEQINCLAQVLAVISKTLDIPITPSRMMTHCEAAELDGYGPSTTCERWDLAVLRESGDWMEGGNELRGDALYYLMHGI